MDRGVDEAVGEMELGGLGALQARFEAVAQGHQFIDFGDDAALFGGWRERDCDCVQLALVDLGHSNTSVVLHRLLKKWIR